MRILLASRHYLPATGGLQASVHQLAGELLRAGHAVAVFTTTSTATGSKRAAHRALRRATARRWVPADRTLGYPVHRGIAAEDVAVAVRRTRPDVVALNIGGDTTLAFSRAVLRGCGSVPVVAYLRDVQALALLDEADFTPAAVLTNSEHLANEVRARGRDAACVPSVVVTDEYRCTSSREVVLYVNPHPRKGVDLAWEIATRRRDIRFVFQEAWRLPPAVWDEYERHARDLGNVELRPVENDPARIYARARIVLAPYLDDNRPRVVAEAQANGIPVVGADVAGMGEAIGGGGLLVGAGATADEWVAALASLWDDPRAYATAVAAATEHARRPDMEPARLADRFVAELAPHAASRR